MTNLKGNILVTGASAGIGAATARMLSQDGYRVFAASRTASSQVSGLANVHFVQMDVSDPESVHRAAEEVGAMVGRQGLQAVVNNAGIIVQGPSELVPPAEWKRQFEVNTLGPAYVTYEFLSMIRQGKGRIVNISAPTARLPIPLLAPIAASKAALLSMSDALRLELSAWGIPVVMVEPGATGTQIFAKADGAARQAMGAADARQVGLYQGHLAAFTKATEKQKFAPVDGVAKVVVTAVTTAKPKRRYYAGRDARLFGVLSHLPTWLREKLVMGAFGLNKVKVR